MLAEDVIEPDRAAAVGQQRDGRLRDPGRRHRPARARTAPVRLAVVGEVRAGVGAGRSGRARDGDPHRDRGADPAGRRRGRAGRADDAADAAARPAGGAAATPPDRCPRPVLVHEAVAAGDGDPSRAATTWPRPRRSSRPGSRLTPAAVALAAGAGIGDGPASIAGRGSRSSRPATRSGRPGRARAGRHPRRERARACGARPRGRGASRLDSGSPPTGSTTSGRGCGRASGEADAVIVRGGVSVGPYDVVRAAFEEVGRVDLWRVAVQPGKPFAFGTADRRRRAGAGRSCSACPATRSRPFVTFELFVRPALRRLAGDAATRPGRSIARVLVEPCHEEPAAGGRSCGSSPSGTPTGAPSATDAAASRSGSPAGAGRGATSCSALAAADALAIVPEARRRLAGAVAGRPLVARPRLTIARRPPAAAQERRYWTERWPRTPADARPNAGA